MRDRLRDLIGEHAAVLADHDGVPVAIRHVHAAAHQVAAWVHQARDELTDRLPQAGAEYRPHSRALVPVERPQPVSSEDERLAPLEPPEDHRYAADIRPAGEAVP